MLRLLALAVLAATASAGAQPLTVRAPETIRLDVLTPTSMYAFAPGGSTFRPSSRSWQATLDGRSVSEAEFYRLVERDALARRATRRTLQSRVMTGAGVAAGVVGAVLMARGTPSIRQCRQERGLIDGDPCARFDAARTLGGAALVIGGTLSVSMALPLSRRVVRAREAADAAERYNASR